MKYNYSNNQPQNVITVSPKRFLNFDVEEVEVVNEDTNFVTTQFRYLTAECNVFNWNYPHVVSAIIRTKYTADDVEAILLNHGDGDEEHEKQYEELQAWRKHAKEIAKQVIK